jgi:5-oxoprolinase (ATP-hydrolysing)
MTSGGWQFWIDRGGTFTDVIAHAPDGRMLARKLLSEAPGRYDDATVAAITAMLREPRSIPAPVTEIRIGTTVATNALLERRGEPTALVITRGFRDQLRLGYQNRPEIFALAIRLPEMLYTAVIEASERVDVTGKVLERLDEAALACSLAQLHERGLRAVAICFLHAWRFPEHERCAGAIAQRIGFTQISMSHEVSPLMRIVSRGDTTVADAYLSPVLSRYVAQLQAGLVEAGITPERLLFMQSNGGLAAARWFRGRDSVLSGPAGGAAGVAETARMLGLPRVIGFDMGGTSTDVSVWMGETEFATDTEIGGVRIRSPVVKIHTIAAGGGSVLRFEDGRFQVGPLSAGAEPGPASYRRGGPLTITDANVLLGRILPDLFPAVFGPQGVQTLDAEVVQRGFAALAAAVTRDTGNHISAEAVADGFLQVAVDNMANAIRHITLARGLDPREFTLCAFGGAGGQHACRVADRLGISRIVIHPLAGLLSAWGIGQAPLQSYRQQSVEQALSAALLANLQPELAALEAACRADLTVQGADAGAMATRITYDLRLAGSDTTLPVPEGPIEALESSFRDLHRRRFGFMPDNARLRVAAVRVEVSARTAPVPVDQTVPPAESVSPRRSPFWDGRQWIEAAVYRRETLAPRQRVAGPAIVVEQHTTTVIDSDWALSPDEAGILVITRGQARSVTTTVATSPDPVLLEVFNNQFMEIAAEMGVVLQNTARSVNVKERLDFSCAVFDGGGQLIANAPHMPVHLGSMGDSVQAIMAANVGRLRDGDAFMLNSPYHGGTHLPDITVVTPVGATPGGPPAFFVGCRAHHADIGGMTPGSMPAHSRSIHDEGVLIENFQLVSAEVFAADALRSLLSGGPWPARNPEQNIADLRAQVAANAAGAQALRRLLAHYGLPVVQAYMAHVQDNAEQCVRNVIGRLTDGEFAASLDSGETLRVRVRVDRASRSAVVDFRGSAGRSPGNFNAPAAITRAAVLYVFRTLVERNIPLNAGCLRPLTIVLPEDSLLDPRAPAAVVAGNVETSQVLTDMLYAALGVMAAAQGTMNNLTFGNARVQYYETICGGAGAGADFHGASGVHTHMTNSRLTDPEVLEARLPVLVREFALRPGSGGAGRYCGGDGVRRVIEFRAPLQVSILSGRRRTAPFGLAGGEPAAPGRNRLVRSNGHIEDLGSTAEATVTPGDRLIIETPGGGGYGTPDQDSCSAEA